MPLSMRNCKWRGNASGIPQSRGFLCHCFFLLSLSHSTQSITHESEVRRGPRARCTLKYTSLCAVCLLLGRETFSSHPVSSEKYEQFNSLLRIKWIKCSSVTFVLTSHTLSVVNATIFFSSPRFTQDRWSSIQRVTLLLLLFLSLVVSPLFSAPFCQPACSRLSLTKAYTSEAKCI